jgi:hypothetical protein
MIEQRSHIADRIAPLGGASALLATPMGKTRGIAFTGLTTTTAAFFSQAGLVAPTPIRRPPLE